MSSLEMTFLTIMIIVLNLISLPSTFAHGWRMVNWKSTFGRIAELRTESVGDSTMTVPRISYEFARKSFSSFHEGLQDTDYFVVNDKILIKVNPKHPEEYIIESWSVVFLSGFVMIFLDITLAIQVL